MNNKISSMSALMGVAFAASASLSPLAAADASLTATSLNAGYTLADNHAGKAEGEQKCGEAKCGAEHKKTDGEQKCGEGKCGAEHKKSKGEGKCGEGKCGAEHKKADGEGKCGEGKCGADKKAQ